MKIQKQLFWLYILIVFIPMNVIAGGNSVQQGNEIAYVHTDRSIYIAGENIFFKLYILDAGTHKLSPVSKIAYLVLRNTEQNPVAKLKLKIDGGIAYGSILLPDSLKSGPYQIIVFTNWMRNNGEESFFAKEISISYRFDTDIVALSTTNDSAKSGINNPAQFTAKFIPLAITSDKNEYAKREKINIAICFPPDVSADSANISVSVTEDAPDLNDEFTLANYLNDKFLYPGSGNIGAGKSQLFLPEVKGEIFRGKVIDQDSRKAVAGIYVFLSAADTLVNIQYALTDSDGFFRFLLNDYYYNKEIYFSITDSAGEQKYKIIPEDKFELTYRFEPAPVTANFLLKEYILKCQDIVTIQKTYDAVAKAEVKKQSLTNFNCPLLYYKPNYRIYPEDFIPLTNFVEMAKEIIPPQLILKKHNDSYSARIADENLHQFMDGKPAIFLDGVFLDDIDSLLNMGSDRIKKVDLVCSRFNCGEIIFPGILAVFSTKNEIKNLKTNSSSLITHFEIFHPCSGFSVSEYAKERPLFQPDFRQLLYWNPDQEIYPGNTSIDGFYASDHSGNYTIRIEGITSGGMPISASSKIKVR